MTVWSLPDGYALVTAEGVRAFAWTGAAAWLTACLGEAGRLHAWAAQHALDSRPGRGPVYVVEAPVVGPDACVCWAVRHYWRGGAVSRLLGDRYWGWGRTRPQKELDASVHLRARGVRTPAVIAGVVYRESRSGFYRADLVTEWVPGARTLSERLRGDAARGRVALARAGAVARSLAQAGVTHRDLNAANVILDQSDDAWVVDLDRCETRNEPGSRAGQAMLRRLERSLVKLGIERGRELSPAEWSELRAGFRGSG